jgi:hypothetical protein
LEATVRLAVLLGALLLASCDQYSEEERQEARCEEAPCQIDECEDECSDLLADIDSYSEAMEETAGDPDLMREWRGLHQ